MATGKARMKEVGLLTNFEVLAFIRAERENEDEARRADGGGAVVGEGQCASDGGGGGGGGGVKRRRFGAANAAASDNNAERLGPRIGVLGTTLQSRSCF